MWLKLTLLLIIIIVVMPSVLLVPLILSPAGRLGQTYVPPKRSLNRADRFLHHAVFISLNY